MEFLTRAIVAQGIATIVSDRNNILITLPTVVYELVSSLPPSITTEQLDECVKWLNPDRDNKTCEVATAISLYKSAID